MAIKVVGHERDINKYWLNLSLEDIPGEKWKWIKFYDAKGNFYDFTGYYKVSNKGRIKGVKRVDCRNQKRHIKIIVQDTNRTYLSIMLSKEAIKVRVSIHRLVLFAFKKGWKLGYDANHINTIRTDNTVENMEWGSRSYNVKYAYKIGTKKTSGCFGAKPKGKDNWLAKPVYKFNSKTGKLIKKYLSITDAANEHGITPSHICQALRGENRVCAGFKWKRNDL